MKFIKKYIILFLSLATITSACDGFLEEELLSTPVSKKFTTQQELNSSLTGLYSSLLGMKKGGYYQRWYLFLQEVPTDISQGSGVTKIFNEFTYTPEESVFQDIYGDIYNTVNRANVMLEKMPEPLNDEYFIKVKGEIKFLRALAYYDLTSLFESVVLITNSHYDPEKKYELSSWEDINKFITDELNEAINLLDVDAPEQRPGAVTKGAALGLLLKTHLRTKQWNEVVSVAEKIRQLNKYDLLPEYNDLWDPTNPLNHEVLFNVMISDDAFDKNLGSANSGSTDLAIFQYDFASDYFGSGKIFPMELKFYYSFDQENDKRWLDVMRHQWINRDGEIIKPVAANGKPQPGFKGPGPKGKSLLFFHNKYPHGDAGKGIDLRNDMFQKVNLPVLRYADVLLSEAEALNEINAGDTESFAKVNAIRQRAGLEALPSDLTQDQLREAILQERAWEFFNEGKRKEDLIRHDKFVEKIENSGKKPIVVDDTNRYYPLPKNELELNPEL